MFKKGFTATRPGTCMFCGDPFPTGTRIINVNTRNGKKLMSLQCFLEKYVPKEVVPLGGRFTCLACQGDFPEDHPGKAWSKVLRKYRCSECAQHNHPPGHHRSIDANDLATP